MGISRETDISQLKNAYDFAKHLHFRIFDTNFALSATIKSITYHYPKKWRKNNMNELKNVHWLKIMGFYSSILITTFFARKLPNLLQLLLGYLTDIQLPWNFNHGLAILFVTVIFYKFHSPKRSEISFFGSNKLKSLLFPIALFTGYSIYGIKNGQDINEHLWAFLFCLFTFGYDLMEEFTWRAYLIERLDNVNLLFKSLISGVFWAVWHLLIFNDFEQYGGFWAFLLFCLIFSLLLTFSIEKTKALIVPASIHALLIRTNIVTLVCLIIYLAILFTWNKKITTITDS